MSLPTIPFAATASAWGWFIRVTDAHPGSASWVQAIFASVTILAAVLIPFFQRRADRREAIKEAVSKRRERTFVVSAMLRGDFHFLLTEVRIRLPDMAGYHPPETVTPATARTYFSKITVPMPSRLAVLPSWIEGTELALVGPINDFFIAIERHNRFINQLITELSGDDVSALPSNDDIALSIKVVSERLVATMRSGRKTWYRLFPDQNLPD